MARGGPPRLGPYLEPRLKDLCEGTDINETLLSLLKIYGIITDEIEEKIKKINGNLSKAIKLYDFLSTTKYLDHIPKITAALKGSTNAVAVQIFTEIFPQNGESGGKQGTDKPQQKQQNDLEWIRNLSLSKPNGSFSKGTAIKNKLISILTDPETFDDRLALQFAHSPKLGQLTMERINMRRAFDKSDPDYWNTIWSFINAWVGGSKSEKATLGLVLEVLEDVRWERAKEKIEEEDWRKILEAK